MLYVQYAYLDFDGLLFIVISFSKINVPTLKDRQYINISLSGCISVLYISGSSYLIIYSDQDL